MCIATRYFFSCRHPATKTFRSHTCRDHNNLPCELRHVDCFVYKQCPNCAWKSGHCPEASLWESRRYQLTQPICWQVPSRHFIDPGFTYLDPFAADRLKNWIQADIRIPVVGSTSRSSQPVIRRAFHEEMHALRWHDRAWFLPDKFRTPILGYCCRDADQIYQEGSEFLWGAGIGSESSNTMARTRAESDSCGSRF